MSEGRVWALSNLRNSNEGSTWFNTSPGSFTTPYGRVEIPSVQDTLAAIATVVFTLFLLKIALVPILTALAITVVCVIAYDIYQIKSEVEERSGSGKVMSYLLNSENWKQVKDISETRTILVKRITRLF